MDSGTLANFGLVLLFVLIGGVFAGTEMAIVNLRQSQLDQLEASGPRGKKIADLARNPNLFLSAVQIGVTVAGFFSSAYGASTIAPDLVPLLMELGLSETTATTLAVVLLTLLIAYLSLVLGELVPKRLGMQNAVQMSRIVTPPLSAFATLMRPVIWLLSKSTNGVLRLLGADPTAHLEAVSVEEIRSLVATSDTLSEVNRRILTDVFEAAERTLVEVMRPRIEVNFLPAAATVTEGLAEARELPNSRYPVFGEDIDDILGFVHLRELLRADNPDTTTVGSIARPIDMLPGTVPVLRAINQMRDDASQIAIVMDEYGGTDGIVTMEDLLEEIVGEIYDEYDVGLAEDATFTTEDTLEVDGGLILQEFEAVSGIELPDDGSYETVAGFILTRLGRVAEVGDIVDIPGYQLEVIGIERWRITRVRVTKVALDAQEAPAAHTAE
jgi:putative hemolysin